MARCTSACFYPLLVTAGLVLALAACRDKAPSTGSPRAIVLVTIDTLRADHVSFNGYAEPTTPFLDGLARRGVVFKQAYAPSSWTPLSMASLFTSLYPTSHGVAYKKFSDRAGRSQPLLHQSVTTLAERLKAAGYRTIGVPSNPLLRSQLGFAQGFDQYAMDTRFPNATQVNTITRRKLREAFGPDYRTAWKKEKVFLWIHYIDPHEPHHPYTPWVESRAPELLKPFPRNPAGMDRFELGKTFLPLEPTGARHLQVLYDSEILRTDDGLKELWRELEPEDDVLLVVTSDHGDEFGEHGALGHAVTLYEEVLRVPLMIRWPARLSGVNQIDIPVSLLDVMPTVLELAGAAPPTPTQGRSLVPLMGGNPLDGKPLDGKPLDGNPLDGNPLDGNPLEPRPLFFELYTGGKESVARMAVREGPWKLLWKGNDTGRKQLYQLEQDPGERTDLAAREPEVVKRLEQTFEREWKRMPFPPPVQERTLTKEDTDELRALGYVGP